MDNNLILAQQRLIKSDTSTVKEASGEQAEIEKLKAELSREQDIYLRAMADFASYCQRNERERDNIVAAVKSDILLSLLNVIDQYEHALTQLKNIPLSLSGCFETIHKMMLTILESHGVVTIQSLGEKLDPDLHEAVEYIDSDNQPAGIIVREVSRGYRIGNQILRRAKVVVSQ
jgi:molecular chaperone GrpE